MEDNYFADTSVYYANKEMVCGNFVLSINTGLIYDIEDPGNVKIVKKATDIFHHAAVLDIKNDGPCFYGRASIYREVLEDEGIGHLIWEL